MEAESNQPVAPRPHRRRFQFSLRTLLLVTLLVSIGMSVVTIGMRAGERLRETRRLQSTRDSFMLTAWSLDYYHERHGHLPFLVRHETVGKPTETGMPNGTGKPLYSWRGEVVTYRDNWFFNMGGRWDASLAWDSPANKQMADYPWQFCYDAIVKWDFPKEYSKNTCMMAITGPGTAFGCDRESPKSLKDVPKNTIIVVEVRDSGIHWMQPGDFDIRTMPETVNALDGHGISSRHPRGFHVLFADLQYWFLSDQVPFETLKKFFTIDEAKRNDREQVLGPYVLWRPTPRQLSSN